MKRLDKENKLESPFEKGGFRGILRGKSTLRLQVFLSHNGVCSRRKAMEVVQSGRVCVNGRVVREPSTPVNSRKDKISVDGKVIQEKTYDYIMLNKPRGYVTTKVGQSSDKTVFDLFPQIFQHLSPAGRLDKDTEGLLLFTNDGDVAYRLTHPKFNLDKTYFVQVSGRLEDINKQKLERGVMVEKKKTAPAKIKNVKVLKDRTELLMTIHEGRKRQIRLMFSSVGHKVKYLKRLSQGPLVLGTLKVGEWRSLTEGEVRKL